MSVCWENGLPVLSTDRLLIRIGTRQEARLVADYFARNREHLRRSGGTRTDSYFTEAYWRETLPLEHEAALAGTAYRFRLFLQGDESRIVGALSVRDVQHGVNHSCQIGYSLDQAHTGRGLMREGVAAAIRFAFEELNLMRIEATYVPDNTRSGRLLAEMGFEVEGTLRKMMMVDGEFADHVICSLLNPGWRRPLESNGGRRPHQEWK